MMRERWSYVTLAAAASCGSSSSSKRRNGSAEDEAAVAAPAVAMVGAETDCVRRSVVV
jgi:hypothetical protein